MKHMKRTLTLLSALLFSLVCGVAHAEDSHLFIVSAKKIFIPQGFDSNDNVQVVLHGTLTGTCEKIAHSEVLPSDDSNEIHIVVWARRFEGICLPIASNFDKEVSLGRLAPGAYDLKTSGIDNAMVNVDEATVDTQDDYNYSPVKQVSVVRDGPQYVAKLKGSFPNSCYQWKESKILDQGDVIVILPIMEFNDNGQCGSEPVSFEEDVALPGQLNPDYHLLHVRSASGLALNKVFFADGD